MDKATRVCNGTTPGFSRILHYCNGPLDAVYGRGSKMCSPNAFFGRCYHGKFCTKQHRKATDAEATEILRVVKPFIDNPEGIKRGVNGWIPAPRTISLTDLMDQCNLCDDNKSKVTISNPSDSPTIPPSTCTNPIPSIDLTDDTTIVIAAPSKHEVNSILKKQPNKRRKRKNKSNPSTKPTKIRFDPKFVAPTPEEQDRIIQQTVHKEDSLPNNVPVKEEIGKCNVKLMKPQKRAEEHPVTPLLHTYADDGCPVDCGEPWSLDHILAMLERGPHISAKSKEAIIQLRAETLDKQKYGYAKVVKWKDIKDNLPLNFKLSPVAMIPHKSRKFRCILDLSFQLFYKGSRLPSVNGQTNKKAVQEAMHQLGSALKRIVATMVDNYEENVSYLFTKIDIKDGYWRMAVSNNDAWNFCYVLPSLQDNIDLDDIEIVVPNSLQMGWSESPPYFCSATETARDIIQELLSGEVLPEHKFEHKMLVEQINNEINSSPLLAVNLLEVFVDDFIAMTNNNNYQHLQHFSRAIIHGVHSIFPPPHVSGHNGFAASKSSTKEKEIGAPKKNFSVGISMEKT